MGIFPLLSLSRIIKSPAALMKILASEKIRKLPSMKVNNQK
jgi:hypothetical protein